MPELTKELLMHDKIGEEAKKLLDTVRKLFSVAEDATIEDFMSEIVVLLSIVERRTERAARGSKFSMGAQERSSAELQNALGEIKQAVLSAIGKKAVGPKDCQKKPSTRPFIVERFYEEGGVTVKEISDQLSISKMTLYNYLRHRGVTIGASRKKKPVGEQTTISIGSRRGQSIVWDKGFRADHTADDP